MAKSETCAVCGQEVRWGWRDGVLAYWHRETVDHTPKFGRLMQPGEWEQMMAAVAEGQRFRNKKNDLESEATEIQEARPLEPIEVRSTSMPHKGSLSLDTPDGPREVPVPGGVRTLLNLAERLGDWEVLRLTYARGPYLGANGSSLGVSDSITLMMRSTLDSKPVYAVASWRDGKSDWAWKVIDKHAYRVGAKALNAWMKEVSGGQS
jgi:hypothetical protein